MYLENNKTVFQQLFVGENIYLFKNEFVENTETHSQTTSYVQYYQSKQRVIILIKSLNPADSELLGKILGAVKLDLQSVDVVDLDNNQDINLSQIYSQRSVSQVITFGISLSKVNLDLKLVPYQILENQGIKFIYSDSLSDIQNDIPKKKALWGSLKEMF